MAYCSLDLDSRIASLSLEAVVLVVFDCFLNHPPSCHIRRPNGILFVSAEPPKEIISTESIAAHRFSYSYPRQVNGQT